MCFGGNLAKRCAGAGDRLWQSVEKTAPQAEETPFNGDMQLYEAVRLNNEGCKLAALGYREAAEQAYSRSSEIQVRGPEEAGVSSVQVFGGKKLISGRARSRL